MSATERTLSSPAQADAPRVASAAAAEANREPKGEQK